MERRNVYRVLLKNLKERDHLEDLDIDWRVILKSILVNRIVGRGLD
jgi:hypothetical protein